MLRWLSKSLRSKSQRKKLLKQLEKTLGVRFRNKKLLNLALTHTSFVNGRKLASYERLEFLVDAVLELTVTDYLYKTFPTFGEGEMTSIRSDSVNEQTLFRIAETINLDKFILINSNILTNDRARKTILADTMEAIFGAVFIDKGYKKARKLILSLLKPFIYERIQKGSFDYKSTLQKFSARHFHTTPSYEVVEIDGPEHKREYTVQVSVNGEIIGEGKGGSKKEAEQAAAKNALENFQER